LALAFIEVGCVVETFKEIKQYLFEKYMCEDSENEQNNINIKKFVECFEKNFILERETWNALSRLFEGLPLTTNTAEGWNRFLNSSFRQPHPSLLQLIKFIQTIQHNNEDTINRIISFTYPINSSRKQTIRKMDIIKNIVVKRMSLSKISFLKSIVLNYNWKLE
jgi:hypothetical protein